MFEETKDLVDETENTEEQTVEETVESTEEETAENVEEVESTEEPKLKYTEDEFNQKVDELVAKKLGRKTAKLEREFKRKYSKLENVLNAGLGTNNVEEATKELAEFYTQKGINIPNEPSFSERETEILANAEANDIISLGYDEISDEIDRLKKIGKDNMSNRDKLIFSRLANEKARIEEEKELLSIGVNREMLNDEKFKEFRENLNPNLSLKDQYEMYLKLNPKKEIKKMGSMKNGATNNIKDFYTYEEASKFTDDDYKNNPDLYKIVEKSALKWK